MTAQGTNRLLTSVKSAFSSTGSIPGSVAPPTHVSQVAAPVTPAPTSVSVTTDVVPAAPEIDLSDDQKLDIWENVLDDMDSSIFLDTDTPDETTSPAAPGAQPLVDTLDTPVESPSVAPQPTPPPATPAPAVVDELENSSNVTQALGQMAISLDPQAGDTLNPPAAISTHKEALGAPIQVAEVPAAAATVEFEPSNEISPEVESYIQKVEDHEELRPQEVVIADGNMTLSPVQYVAQPVIVLPITPEIETEGQKKGPKFSVKWLVEWSHKMIKMFAGKVVYREQ